VVELAGVRIEVRGTDSGKVLFVGPIVLALPLGDGQARQVSSMLTSGIVIQRSDEFGRML